MFLELSRDLDIFKYMIGPGVFLHKEFYSEQRFGKYIQALTGGEINNH